MTLHDTTELSKKAAIWGSIGLGGILLIVMFVKVGGFIHTLLFPPKIQPPNVAYGTLPSLIFPPSTVNGGPFTYKINTISGTLPQDFPDRLIIYPMIMSQPNYSDLSTTEQNVGNLQFQDVNGNALPAVPLGSTNGSTYEWKETAPGETGYQRTIIYNIVNQNFSMSSDYLTSLTALNTQNLGTQTTAVSTVQGFLSNVNNFPTDIDLTLTQSPDPSITYTTTPQLFSISAGQLNPTTSLSNAQIIRVDLYQKEIDYSLTAGQDQDLTHFQNFDMKLPILYPHPPYSTMNFLIASGQTSAEVVAANFNHQTINLQPTVQATYPIKTAQQAFIDLQNGKGYIAAYNGTDTQILITNVFLAYYLGTAQQNYLEPIVVFEGQNGFFAYVPAISQ